MKEGVGNEAPVLVTEVRVNKKSGGQSLPESSGGHTRHPISVYVAPTDGGLAVGGALG